MYRFAGINKYYNKHIFNTNYTSSKRYGPDNNNHRQSAAVVNASQQIDPFIN